MSKYNLTPIEHAGAAVEDDVYRNGTADLVNYGLRHGGTQAEYDLAIRLQELREMAFELVEQEIEEGYPISDSMLALLDTEKEVMAKERLTK